MAQPAEQDPVVLEARESAEDPGYGLAGSPTSSASLGQADSLGEADSSGAEGPASDDTPLPGAAFARAFTRVLQQPSGPTTGGALSVNKTAKRRAQTAKDARAAEQPLKAAQTLRRHLRRRGHKAVPVKGEDPEHDLREKAFSRLATRGVVQLFNAISKAQERRRGSAQPHQRSKAARLERSSFLADLHGKSASKEECSAQKPATAPAWDVLQPDKLPQLQGGMRLRDWENKQDTDSE